MWAQTVAWPRAGSPDTSEWLTVPKSLYRPIPRHTVAHYYGTIISIRVIWRHIGSGVQGVPRKP